MTKVVADVPMSLGPTPTWRTGSDRVGSPSMIGRSATTPPTLHLHLAPMVLGKGDALFHGDCRIQTRQIDVQFSANATHLTYQLS